MKRFGLQLLVVILIYTGVGVPSFFSSTAAIATGPEWLTRTWQTDDGLPENSATAMVQTRDGYLWFGTFNGLVRFDGISFKVFTPANTPGLPHAAIVNLYLDSKDRLWASTYAGLAVREGGQWRTVGNLKDFVRTFSERDNGDLLITLFGGPVLEFSGGKLNPLPDPPGEQNRGYFGFAGESGTWWVVQNRFIGQWNGREWIPTIPLPVGLASDKVGCGVARDGSMWLFLQTELRKYQKGLEVKRIPVPPLKGGFWSLSEDSSGTVWICTPDQGLFEVSESAGTQHWTAANGLAAMGTRFVFEDRENNVWIGTSGGGLMRWNKRQIQTFGAESGLAEPVVSSVSPARTGGVWIATYGKGLFRLDADGIREVPLPGPPASWRYTQSVLEDRAGRVWVGTFNRGLFRLGGEKIEHFDGQLTGGSNVVSLYEDSASRIWMGGGSGVAFYRGTNFQVFTETENAPRGAFRCFQEDREGAIWLSNLEGIFRFQNGKFKEVKVSGPIKEITCLKSSSDGSIWMGSMSRGLLRWKEGRLSIIGEKSAFPLSAVYAIEEDGRGFFWMTSNHGMVRASKHQLQAIADGRESRPVFQRFDIADGLPTTQFSSERQPTAVCDSNGKLWLATIKGVAVLSPNEFQANQTVPVTHIEELTYYSSLPAQQAGNREPTRLSAPWAEALTLPAGSRRLEFRYTGLSFAAPGKLRFQIQLQGENRAWETVGERRIASYFDLKPGRYTFRVRSENKAGVLDPTGASLVFTILPFFWQTAWFRAALAGLLLAAGWGAARWHTRATQAVNQTSRRMALASEVAQLGMWEWDILTDQVLMTKKCSEMFSVAPDTPISYQNLLEGIYPEDRTLFDGAVQLALKRGAYHLTHRLGLTSQGSRWIAASGLVDFDRAHNPVRLVGVCMDISERHQAEEDARELSGRLIHAQEDERRRIARDLHDDLNQRLALLSVEMELLERDSAGANARPDPRLEQVASQIRELSSEVHKLSYQLHPAKLDQLGLVAAARNLCRDLAQQSRVKIDFIQENVPREIPADVALCLYRVIQESLQNMVKHSRAREAKVQLRFEHDRLKLLVADSGKGFDLEAARTNAGLGLLSMKERVRLVRGTIRIHSTPGSGTQIGVDVPVLGITTPLRS